MVRQRQKPPFSEDTLQNTLIRVLRPLVKLSLASGLNFTAFSAILRRLFIEVAEDDFALPAKQQTDSRISLLTGIHRKDVSRLRGQRVTVASLPAAVSQTARIIALWLADPRYCEEDGQAKPLPRTAQEDQPSFELLVSEVTRDFHPRAVLDEWLDRGIATIDDNDQVHLDPTSIVPKAADEARRHYFTRNLHDHAMAAVSNVLNDPPPYFERAVHYDRISASLAAELDELSRQESMAMLLRLNRIAHQAIQNDAGGDSRWITGIYVLNQTGETEATPDTASAEKEARQ